MAQATSLVYCHNGGGFCARVKQRGKVDLWRPRLCWWRHGGRGCLDCNIGNISTTSSLRRREWGGIQRWVWRDPYALCCRSDDYEHARGLDLVVYHSVRWSIVMQRHYDRESYMATAFSVWHHLYLVVPCRRSHSWSFQRLLWAWMFVEAASDLVEC
jgi:hypothetical protein